MKHFVQKKDFLEVSGSWMIWLWRNSPGKLHLKIKSSGRHWKNLPSDLSSLLGKTVSQITYLSIADHARDTQLRWTVLIVLFPDFTWKWGAVALPVPLVRLNLSVAPHHSLPTWPWAPVSPPARAHHTDPWLGRAGEIFKKYLKSTGHEAPSAFLLAELLFSFSAIYWLPKLDERPSWADNNST